MKRLSDRERILRKKYYNYKKVRINQGQEYLSREQWQQFFESQGKDPATQTVRMPVFERGLARIKFSRHRAQARYRGIDFEFDFESWDRWWLSHGVDKNLDVKWNNDSGRLCMCRYGDEGPYAEHNVYLATHSQNARDSAKNIPREWGPKKN
jgi:hypothetical protein